MAFGEGPFVGFSASYEEDGVERTDADASVYLIGGSFIATKCLWEDGCCGRVHDGLASTVCSNKPFGFPWLNFMRGL